MLERIFLGPPSKITKAQIVEILLENDVLVHKSESKASCLDTLKNWVKR